MSLCVRCSAPNLATATRCGRCGATLPRIAGEDSSSRPLLTLEEGRSYPSPTESFDTENLAQLRMAVEEYLVSGDAEQVHIWLKLIRRHFEEFSTHGVTQLMGALDVERNLNEAGDFHHDVAYLVRKGVVLCEEGLAGLDQCLSRVEDEQLLPFLELFRSGNDHICTALLMISQRQEMLEAAISRYAPEHPE